MAGRILVVEDDQLQRSVLQTALRRNGYEVETASDGLQAIWQIREGSFDLVIIDYVLPEIDGMGTARLIVDLMGDAARPRMIALTARPDSVHDREAASGQAFDAVIAKSGNVPALLAMVDEQMRAVPDPERRRAAEGALLLREWSGYEDQPPRHAAEGPVRARILVVEDDALQQSVLRSALSRFGYQVEACSDGLDAVRRIREGGFDLVLVDYLTPELDGLATARLVGALLSEAARPRLVALTATPERLTAWEAGSGKVFDAIVAKSTSLPALFAIIARELQAREADDGPV